MDKVVELLFQMFQNGFTAQGVWQLGGLFVGFCVLVALTSMATLIVYSWLIGRNKRLVVANTWLRFQTNAGATFPALYFKKGYLKVWCWNSVTGDLMEFSTMQFSKMPKNYIKNTPEGIDPNNIPSPSAFGL